MTEITIKIPDWSLNILIAYFIISIPLQIAQIVIQKKLLNLRKTHEQRE